MHSSPLLSAHARQRLTTREALMDAALALFRDKPTAPFSHEAVATRSGIAARTVYRHFPTQADLLAALWERLRDETGIRWPTREEDIIPFVREGFKQFDAHESLVRAAIVAGATIKYTIPGSAEGRAAFGQALAGITRNLSNRERDRLVAVCLAIYSAPFWQMLHDRGQLTHAEAQDAAAWALESVLASARSRAATGPRGRPRASRKRGRVVAPPLRTS